MKPLFILISGLVLCASVVGQSLWNPDRPMPSLFTDTIARNVGDILTVVIDESQIVKNKELSKLEKESTLDAVLENFDILPNLFEPLPAAKGTSTRTFDGKGTYDKDNSFRTTMSVVVIDRLPNGNLLIEGTRSIIMDGETKSIRLTGLVRGLDVTSVNTVLSSQIANASIAYEGEGFLNQATNRGWFSRLLDIVWPF